MIAKLYKYRFCLELDFASKPHSFSGSSTDFTDVVLKGSSDGDLLSLEMENHLKGICGTLLLSFPESIRIVTDTYGILPVYCYRKFHRVVFFTHFTDLNRLICSSELTPDKAGIMEAMLFDSSLNRRTIFQEISLIAPGTCADLSLTSGDLSLTKYSNFSFQKLEGIDLHEAGEAVSNKLKNALGELDDRHFLLPLSGGVDSRLLAGAMVDVYGPDCITALSFACRTSSYELRYAKQVCDTLGIKDWKPYILDRNSYLSSLEVFPQKLGGNLSISHGHLFNAISDNRESLSGMTLVSGAFADAAGGFHASQPQELQASVQDSHYCHHLYNMDSIASLSNVIQTIREDIYDIYSLWKTGSSIQTFDEYFYVTNRQPRVIFTQSSLYRDFMTVIQPFTNPVLSSFLFALPYEQRAFKASIRSAIQHISPNLSEIPDVSSKMVYNTLPQLLHFYRGKFANNLARIATRSVFDSHLFFSPYQTECQDYNLRTFHRKSVLGAFESLNQRGLLTQTQVKVFSQKPYKQYGGGILPCIQYWALTVSRTLECLGIDR